MENKQTQNLLSVVAIIVAVLGISIGYTTYSSSLELANKVSHSTNVANKANVDFSSNGLKYVPTDVVPTVSSTRMVANNAVINNTVNPTVSGISAIFTTPGESVTYKFYATNRGEAIAFLNALKINNIEGTETNKLCTPGNATHPVYVEAACNDIELSVKVGEEIETTSNIDSINGHTLAKSATEVVTVTVTYLSNGHRVNGDFNVTFGDIELVYSNK